MADIDWKVVAVNVARAKGWYNLLTTPERDALEAAIREYESSGNPRGYGQAWAVEDAQRAGYRPARCGIGQGTQLGNGPTDECRYNPECVKYADCLNAIRYPVADPRE